MVISIKLFPVIKYQCVKTTYGINVLAFSNLVNEEDNIPDFNTYSLQFDLSKFNPNKDGVLATRISDGVHDILSSYVAPIRGTYSPRPS